MIFLSKSWRHFSQERGTCEAKERRNPLERPFKTVQRPKRNKEVRYGSSCPCERRLDRLGFPQRLKLLRLYGVRTSLTSVRCTVLSDRADPTTTSATMTKMSGGPKILSRAHRLLYVWATAYSYPSTPLVPS